MIPNLGIGGAEVMTTILSEELANRGHEVAVISLFPIEHNAISARLASSGVAIVSLDKKLGMSPAVCFRLSKTIMELQPDIIHTHRYALRYLALYLLRPDGCPVVHTSHNVPAREVDSTTRLLFKLWFRWRRVRPVVLSPLLARSFEDTYGQTGCAIVPNGIRIAELSAQAAQSKSIEWRRSVGVPDRRFVLAFVGRLQVQKDPTAALNILAACVRRDIDAHLCVFGEGPLEAEVRRHIASCDLEDRVTMLGMRTDVPAGLSAADCLVMPSRWEGLPLAAIEAMALGTPVIASSVGDLPHLLRDGAGVVILPGDISGFADAVVTLAIDSAFRDKIVDKAIARSLAYSHEVMVDGYERVYREASWVRTRPAAS